MTGDESEILDLVRESVFVRDLRGHILSWNRASEELYGFSRAQAVGQPAHELLGTESALPLAELDANIVLAGRWEGELARRTATGVRLVVAARSTLRRDAAGMPRDIVECGRDVGADKQALERLRDREERYRNLFQYMPIPAWRNRSPQLGAFIHHLRAQGIADFAAFLRDHPEVVDRAMELIIVEDVNQAAIRLFGVKTADDFRGAVSRRRWVSRRIFISAFEARLRGEETFSAEVKFRTVDGRVLEGLLFTAFPPPLSASGISFNTFVDATERVRTQEMLQKVQTEFAHAARISMLGELTASIAHEVNQPLAAIATNGEAGLRWLNRSEPDLAEARELMKRMVVDARRAADIISRVRGMATRGIHQRAPVSLHQTIEEVLLFLRHEIQLRKIAVEYQRADPLPEVLADRTQLQQVLVNLAVNAMQAMTTDDAPRRLGVRTTLPDASRVRCIIEDSGPGIAPEHLGRMFESFFTTKESGMGIGLPICRSIIEAHDGRIEVDNQSAYGGARFSFTLPVNPASVALPASA
jgi:PAS domain S-box-containing protein